MRNTLLLTGTRDPAQMETASICRSAHKAFRCISPLYWDIHIVHMYPKHPPTHKHAHTDTPTRTHTSPLLPIPPFAHFDFVSFKQCCVVLHEIMTLCPFLLLTETHFIYF